MIVTCMKSKLRLETRERAIGAAPTSLSKMTAASLTKRTKLKPK